MKSVKKIVSSKDMTDEHFLWKTKESKFLKTEDMATRHLFFTIRMIYNNTVPDNYQHHPVKLYKFGEFYTKEYFAIAVRVMLQELSKREDLTSYMKSTLKFIRKNIDLVKKESIE